MKALALVVGNAVYPLDKNRLDNAVNDASDFADKLETLQFKVIRALNCKVSNFDKALANFEKELKHYDTGALLNHIGDKDIPIEEFFKRVRTSVYTSTNGKQTSWEHTSMIGNFSFNAGQMIHSVALSYRPDYVADGEYISEGREIDSVIEGLREHVWDTQRNAISKLTSINKKSIDTNSKFLLGRNILQAATGNLFAAADMMNDLNGWLPSYSDGDLNHVLNGVLFEMYFDHNGEFRKGKINNDFIDKIFEIQTAGKFPESFKFIREQLSPFSEYLFWIPGNPQMTVPIEANFEKKEEIGFGDKPDVKYRIIFVKHAGTELLQSGYSSSGCDFKTFRQRVALALSVPLKLVRLSVNIKEVETSTRLSVPSPFRLSKIPEVNELEELDF